MQAAAGLHIRRNDAWGADGPTRYGRGVEDRLLAWFAEHGRDLPWRRTRDPYAILVSEAISQQYGIEIVDLPAMQAFSG